jgi:hypothetical protein
MLENVIELLELTMQESEANAVTQTEILALIGYQNKKRV